MSKNWLTVVVFICVSSLLFGGGFSEAISYRAVEEDGGKIKRPALVQTTALTQIQREKIQFQGPDDEKRLALTFDDGPDPVYTERLLDLLKEEDIKATFFVLGYKAKQHPSLLKRMVAEGHSIGNHSFTHQELTKLEQSEVLDEVEQTQAVIEEATGVTTDLVRAPYGSVNDMVVKTLTTNSYHLIGWSIDSLDWQYQLPFSIAMNVVEDAHSGGIILHHDGTATSYQLFEDLPAEIEWLKEKGYTFVTVPELVHLPEAS
ncbi:hypothetical protein J26TS2_05810 [Shouchella clausii]|nr:hypothetical protein J26TS2_05810 [Shouchella clausii]